MRVRAFWRDCTFRHKAWRGDSVHAFCVEATAEEAAAVVFPSLSQQKITESNQLAEEYGGLAAMMGDATLPFCFLVARDLSSIDPFPPHYPFHPMWNAYSPFQSMPEVTIATLDDLRDVVLPLVLAASETGDGQEAEQR